MPLQSSFSNLQKGRASAVSVWPDVLYRFPWFNGFVVFSPTRSYETWMNNDQWDLWIYIYINGHSPGKSQPSLLLTGAFHPGMHLTKVHWDVVLQHRAGVHQHLTSPGRLWGQCRGHVCQKTNFYWGEAFLGKMEVGLSRWWCNQHGSKWSHLRDS